MVKFSEEAKSLHASDIREILKVTENPEIISFAGGLPAPELFPIDEMMKVDVEILKKEGRQAVQYSTTEGYVPLRKQIAKRMKTSFHTLMKISSSPLAPSRAFRSWASSSSTKATSSSLKARPTWVLRRLLPLTSRISSKLKRMTRAWFRKPWKQLSKNTGTASA